MEAYEVIGDLSLVWYETPRGKGSLVKCLLFILYHTYIDNTYNVKRSNILTDSCL